MAKLIQTLRGTAGANLSDAPRTLLDGAQIGVKFEDGSTEESLNSVVDRLVEMIDEDVVDLGDEIAARIAADLALQATATAHAAANVVSFAAATTDRAAVRSEIVVAKSAADQALVDAKVIADAAMSSEEAARISGDAGLQAALSAEASSRDASILAAKSAADQALVDAKVIADAAMVTETARATAAEGVNAANIANIISNVDAVALDSLTEVVAAFQAADNTLTGAVAALSTTHNSDLATEVARAQLAETTEEAARISGDAGLQAALSAEASSRDASILAAKSAADQALVDAKVIADAAMSSEEAARISGDAGLQAALSAEASSRDASILAAKSAADQALVDAKVIADAALAAANADRAALRGDELNKSSSRVDMVSRWYWSASPSGTSTHVLSGVAANFAGDLPYPGSELVFLNGLMLSEGYDYTYVNNGGSLELTFVDVTQNVGGMLSLTGLKNSKG